MKIILSNNVKFAIRDIFNYSAELSTNYANKTVNGIYKTLFNIKEFPYIGRYVPELPDTHFRERFYKDYRIIYFISETNKTIYIRYIFSSKQNSNLFFKVHKKEILKFLNHFFIF